MDYYTLYTENSGLKEKIQPSLLNQPKVFYYPSGHIENNGVSKKQYLRGTVSQLEDVRVQD